MTTQRDFKRVVRARMEKTGESYTAARANILKHPATLTTAQLGRPPAAAPATAPAPAAARAPQDYARLAGMSDDAIKGKTGCGWDKWVKSLDYVKAYNWPHREIASYVHEKYKVPSWWSQAVTVGYERIKGLRDIGQRRGGGYEASRSRTFPVSVSKLFAAVSQKQRRNAWLGGAELIVKKMTKNKTVRLTWGDGTPVELYFVSQDRKKAQLTVQHRNLASRAAGDKMKAFWAGRLDALAAHLDGAPSR